MYRRQGGIRASSYLAVALALGLLACGQAFQSAAGDAGEGEGGIILGDGGEGHDATSGDAGSDTAADVRHDGPADGGADHDGSKPDAEGMPETGGTDVVTTETGGGCPSGWLTCSDGGCVQPSPTNCGTCGNDCTALPHVTSAQCTSGQCSVTCLPGWGHCTSNPDDGCETNTTTAQNCDMCGTKCSNPTPICAAGTGCVSGCPSGKPTLCNGTTCVDTTTDPQNCITCGNVCPAGPANSQPTCASSACGWQCNTGYTECGTSCFDENNDVNHCGSCTNACPAGPPNSTTTCSSATCGWTCNGGYQQCGNACIPLSPDGVHGVFVAQGGATSSCGSESAPCGTIAAALTAVQQSAGAKTIVYVADSPSAYVEQITLPAGVTIQGGWVYMGGGQWTHPCPLDASQVVIQAPAGDDRVVIASYAGSSQLDTLTIANKTTAAAGTATTGGQSLYGVFAANAQPGQTTLTLSNVIVTVNAGGVGGTGGQGPAGGAPATNCTSSDGADGGAGTTGAGATSGTYDVNGFHPASGQQGTRGADGHNGLAPPATNCVFTYVGAATTNGNCCDVGGNGCGTCTTNQTVPICSSQGSNGCGSGGSQGGYGGTGGGASIGVFVWNTNVSLDGVKITTGGGGAGENGGPGGTVSPGSMGATGAQSVGTYSTTCHNTGCPSNCLCSDTPTMHVPGGSPGGQGGTGGTGGQGGGGAGGDSFCYFEDVAGLVTATNVTCSPGAGGSGGDNGAAQGASNTTNM